MLDLIPNTTKTKSVDKKASRRKPLKNITTCDHHTLKMTHFLMPPTAQVTFSKAGHTSVLLLRCVQEVKTMKSQGWRSLLTAQR